MSLENKIICHVTTCKGGLYYNSKQLCKYDTRENVSPVCFYQGYEKNNKYPCNLPTNKSTIITEIYLRDIDVVSR